MSAGMNCRERLIFALLILLFFDTLFWKTLRFLWALDVGSYVL